MPVSNGNRGVYEEFEELDESRGEKNGRTIRGKVLILLVLLFTNFCAHLPEDLCDFGMCVANRVSMRETAVRRMSGARTVRTDSAGRIRAPSARNCHNEVRQPRNANLCSP